MTISLTFAQKGDDDSDKRHEKRYKAYGKVDQKDGKHFHSPSCCPP